MGKFRKAKYGDYVSCTQFESRQGRKVDMDRLGKCVLEYSKSVFQRGSPGLVVTGGDSQSEGREFESQFQILDGHILH